MNGHPSQYYPSSMQSNFVMVALWNRADHIFSCCSLFFFFFPHLCRLDVCHTWCAISANLRCRSETCCTHLAENTGCKKVTKNRNLGTIPQLCRAISSRPRHVSTIRKNVLSSDTSSTGPDNMVNFGPLTAEIGSGVWGTPTNFNGFCVLAALLYGI